MAKTLNQSSAPSPKPAPISTIITCCIIAVLVSTLPVAVGTAAFPLHHLFNAMH